MPARTNTDAIRELEIATAALRELTRSLRHDVDRVDAAHAKTADTLRDVITRLTVLEAKFTDLNKALEESDRKRWMLTMAVIGTFLALVANIALSFLRKQASARPHFVGGM